MGDPDAPADHDELLRRYLATASAPCPVCAYDLRELTSSKCPECGAALELRVGSSDLRLGLWLVALFSVGLPFGFFAIFFVLAIVMSLIEPFGGPPPLAWLSLICGAVVFGAATMALVRLRRWYWSRRRSQQVSLAALLTIHSVALTIGLMIMMLSD